LMIKDGAVKVVEFNCRFGDPETQAVVPLLEGDFLKLLYSTATCNLDIDAVRYSGKSAVCVVAASYGYPDFYDTGFEIFGLQDITDPGIFIFHAGTKSEYQRIVTSGGRVLGLTAVAEGNDISGAKQKAYENLRRIHYENIYYRTDISDKALKKA
jgi:phosphoribosylamine---glycine ligase